MVLAATAVLWLSVPTLFGDHPPGMGDRSASAAADRATYAQEVTSTRTGVLTGLVGLAGLLTIGINLRNARTQLETLATTQKTFRVTERGHLTDRYAKAIEQLGNTGDDGSIAIRLGGIYALQQLAADTDRGSDQATVVEVLSAFVRLNLRAGLTEAPPTEDPDGDAPAPQPAEPRADVLAAISVLAQLRPRADVEMRADFTGLDFTGFTLSRARLRGADLTGVRLIGADLRGADLFGARLSGTNLRNADLTSARPTNADLRAADLTGAKLAGAFFASARMRGAELVDADLTNAHLGGADLRHAVLVNATLTRTNLSGANLAHADLSDADLTGADLARSDVTGIEGLTERQLASAWARPDGTVNPPAALES